MQGIVVDRVSQAYPIGRAFFGRRSVFHAVDDVSLTLAPGETLGVVGESGSGKSTLGRMVAGIEAPTSGHVLFWGERYAPVGSRRWRQQRRDVQVVFQNPAAVVDPRWSIQAQVREALNIHEVLTDGEQIRRVNEILDMVGLGDLGNRLPHQLSGGQLQRAVIARALVMGPKVLICDEAVSALDVSVQAQIINLLMRLRERLGLAMLFISHDLSIVRHISHRVGVMYQGKLLEVGESEALFQKPQHDYTRRLLSSIPIAHPNLRHQREAALET